MLERNNTKLHAQIDFMVTPCANNIQRFNKQLTHTALKKPRVIKTF